MTDAPAYSEAFFDTFAVAIPDRNTTMEVDGVVRHAPPAAFPRLLDLACGIGRSTRRFVERGYDVTGIDASVAGLRRARAATPAGRFVALDFRDVGSMGWQFDVVTSFWNSIGFGTTADDETLLRGVRRILRPGGRLILDLYHPDWLAAHQLQKVADPRGAIVDRWLADGRSCHVFTYPDGTVEEIRFCVYHPDEMARLIGRAGLTVDRRLVWWEDALEPGSDHARYQLVCTRP